MINAPHKKIQKIVSHDFSDSNENISNDYDYGNLDYNQKPKTRLGVLLWVLLFILIISSVYFLLERFSIAKVTIEPRKDPFSFKDQYFSASHQESDSLHFEIMIVDAEEKKHVVLTNTEKIDSKATGEVVIYNAFSTKPQKLTINTRLADDEGRIFMTNKAVSIPGYTTLKGKIVPGSVVVGIQASASGDSFNGEPRDFSILGYKGTTKYSKIYARSKGPISGGSSGLVYVMSPQEMGEIVTQMKTNLMVKLQKKMEAQVPASYILYPDSMKFDIQTSDDNFRSKNSDALFVIKGSLSGILFKEKELTLKIAYGVDSDLKDFEANQITIPEIKKLKFNFANGSSDFSKNTNNINFFLNGDGILLWHPNVDKIKNSLMGINKNSLDSIFKNDRSIGKANVVFRPPWQSIVPNDLSKISIVIKE